MTTERTTREASLPEIPPASSAASAAARRLLDGKTKPLGSLGRIEDVAAQLAAIFETTAFETVPRAVVVLAADHGVTARGVSAYPREVTAQMLANFAAGGAAINVLGRQMDAEVVVVDVGVASDAPPPRGVRDARIACGTADMTVGPAMSVEQALRALATGVSLARELSARGMRIVATGDMGIGNTTAASALTGVFTGRAPDRVTGRGTGVDDRALERKIAVVERALEVNRPSPDHPLAALAAVGGFEIAALAGLILGAAAERRAVVLDGFIAGAAALAADRLAPAVRPYMLAGHRSAEPGHAAALELLGLEPLLDLGLRLGEGTGAVLALPILDAAARILREMASFESAGVSRK